MTLPTNEAEPVPVPKSVLLVEDAKNWLELNTMVLKRTGANVIGVNNANEAIEVLTKQDFTHLITDGLEGDWKKVVEEARKKNIESITVLSGTEELKSQVLALGVNFVYKPDISTGKVEIKSLIE